MSPATRVHRTTPPPEPPAVAILEAAAAGTAVRGAQQFTATLRAAEHQAWEQQPDSKEIETWAIT